RGPRENARAGLLAAFRRVAHPDALERRVRAPELDAGPMASLDEGGADRRRGWLARPAAHRDIDAEAVSSDGGRRIAHHHALERRVRALDAHAAPVTALDDRGAERKARALLRHGEVQGGD